MALLFFKIFPIKIYTLSHAFEAIVEALLPLWGIFTTCILNASTASSGVEKRWALILFFTYGNKKKSFGAKSGPYGEWLIKLMFWVLKNVVVWADVWQLALSWWRVIRLQRLVFLISCKTTGKQMFVYHTELIVLHGSSGTIATCPVFPKKHAIIRLEELRARTTFVGFGSSWNTHTVDCCLLSGSYA